MAITDKPQGITSARMLWLDWVRVLAMGMIFLFHSIRPFVIFPSWHIMNPTPDLGFTLFDTFISGWIMPLFFAVSGIAVVLLYPISKINLLRFLFGMRMKNRSS